MRKASTIRTAAVYLAPVYLAAVCLLAIGGAVPAAAQEDYRAIVTIMRACAQIADLPARVLCYDNNIRPQAGTPAPAAQAPAAAPVSVAAPPSFGSEMLAPSRSVEAAAENAAMTARVTAIAPQEPGIYLITLADGAQWRFVDAAPSAWYPPRAGDEIELERGSLGSVFLRYDGQRRLRVRRVR